MAIICNLTYDAAFTTHAAGPRSTEVSRINKEAETRKFVHTMQRSQSGAWMLALKSPEFLRLAITSGMIGLAIFCLPYSTLVWRRCSSTIIRPNQIGRVALMFLFHGASGLLLEMSSSFLKHERELREA